MRRVLLFLFIQLTLFSVFAQNFKFKAKLEPVKNNGFYKIELSPEIVARAKYSMADLRLMSDDGKEIPFILNNEPASFYEKDFVSFPIEENTSSGNIQTLLIHNPNHQAINNLVIEMKNAYGHKKIRISGSDDKTNWYMLHQGFPFTVPGNENSTMVYQAIDFPLADYNWFSIAFMDTMPLSLNILRVGNYKQRMVLGNYCKVPVQKFTLKDSVNKKSYLHILLKEPNRVNKLKVNVSKPDVYLRTAQLHLGFLNQATREKTYSSHRNDVGAENFQPLHFQPYEITFNSDFMNEFDIIQYSKIKSIDVVIENKDNQPLVIDSIQVQQLKTWLSAKLENGKTYFLQFGDSTLAAPDYDLRYFENKIPPNIPIIKHLVIQSNEIMEQDVKENKNNTKVFIWVALGLAGLLLAFMTNKMLREIKRDR